MTTAQAGSAMEMVETGQFLPGYFQALGIPLLAGRFSTETDGGSAQPVVVISQEGARMLFPGTSPLGQRIVVDDKPREVIGIVGDVRHWGANTSFGRPRIYLPFGSVAASPLTLVIRMRPGAPLPVDQLRSAAAAIGPRVFVDRFRPASEWLSTNTARPRHRTQLFALLGGFALVLALVGIFSMTSYAVASRTRELGVRLALGARASQIVGIVVRDAAWPMGVGVVVGLVGAALATRVIASFLFNTAPADPRTFAVVAVLLFGTGCVAAWLPARHVARIDPVIALKTE
jgi:ABC-type antimicrobial peptide transport system permease subunit